jgi:hypothetical protein
MQSGKLLLTPLANKKETVQNKSADASTRSSNELDTRCRLRTPQKKCRWLTVTWSRHKKSLPRLASRSWKNLATTRVRLSIWTRGTHPSKYQLNVLGSSLTQWILILTIECRCKS